MCMGKPDDAQKGSVADLQHRPGVDVADHPPDPAGPEALDVLALATVEHLLGGDQPRPAVGLARRCGRAGP